MYKIAIVLLSLLALGADWPMFHGADGLNRSTETGLLRSWSEEGPPLLWKIAGIGEGISGYSSVTIQGNRLFTTGSMNGRSIVYCFDLDGQKIWEYDNGPVWTKSYHGVRSTPTIDGDRVYDLSSLGELVCLDITAGKRVWSRNILTDFEADNIKWAIAESVRIDGEKLFCSPGGRKGSVVALDKLTGQEIWVAPSTGVETAYVSPTIFEQGGLRILATLNAQSVFGVNIETGEMLFSFDLPQVYGVNCTRPLYHAGHLFITNPATPPNSAGGVMLQVHTDKNKVTVEEVWRNKRVDNCYDGLFLEKGFLFGSSYQERGGMFQCVDWKTGEIRYSTRDLTKGTFAYAEGLLYFLDEQGEFRLLRPNPDKYDVVSRWKIPEGGEGSTWANPVICNKRLYIRHGEFLYCYDITWCPPSIDK